MSKIIEFMQNNIGFSWKGFLIFSLPMLPNILFFLFKDPNGSLAATNQLLLLDIIEHGSQAIFIALLIFIVSKKESPLLCGYTILILTFLLTYCGFWIVYFTWGANYILLMSMAIFPVIYFILAEIWLHNILAIPPTVIFGIVHIIITHINANPLN